MAYTTINKSSDHFNTLTYTGTGSSGTKTGVGFQSDWTWIKARGNTTWHYLYDAVRGAGIEKEIFSNSNDQEGAGDAAAYGYLSAFTSDGFSTVMGSNTGSDGLNKSGTDGPYISASIIPTFFPLAAKVTARFEVKVLFPTPPFPEATQMTFLTFGIFLFSPTVPCPTLSCAGFLGATASLFKLGATS